MKCERCGKDHEPTPDDLKETRELRAAIGHLTREADCIENRMTALLLAVIDGAKDADLSAEEVTELCLSTVAKAAGVDKIELLTAVTARLIFGEALPKALAARAALEEQKKRGL